jgi:putative colanic acid biosynthesis UDP-glucose lipid carrier transferase
LEAVIQWIKSIIPGRFSRFLPAFIVTGDILLLLVSLFGSISLLGNNPNLLFDRPVYFGFLGFSLVSWLACLILLKSYTIKRINSLDRLAKNTIITFLYHIFLVSAYIVATEAYFIPRNYLLSFFSMFILGVSMWRFGIYFILGYLRKLGLNYRNVVIIGYNPYGLSLKHYFDQNPGLGYRFKGFFDNWPQRHSSIVGKFQRSLEDFLKTENIDEIYVCQSYLKHRYFRHLVRYTENHFLKIKLLPDIKGLVFDDLELEFYSNLPIISFRREPLQNELNAATKRIFDVVFASFVLLGICSWLFPLIAILIKLDSRGPIFFKQQRSGRAGKDFLCFKFRTMVVNSEADTRQATKNDDRITRLGRFLRESNIDELPQFINVLLGDMSVVGPRPHMLKHTQEYSKTISNYMLRHLIKPGVTGLAQAKGYRGQTDDNYSMKNRVRVDILYIERWTFLLDLKVIGLTVKNMFKGEENAY